MVAGIVRLNSLTASFDAMVPKTARVHNRAGERIKPSLIRWLTQQASPKTRSDDDGGSALCFRSFYELSFLPVTLEERGSTIDEVVSSSAEERWDVFLPSWFNVDVGRQGYLLFQGRPVSR
jgi:hypothetical protein